MATVSKPGQKCVDGSLKCRAGNGRCHETDSTLLLLNIFQNVDDAFIDFPPFGRLPLQQRLLQTMTVVQAEWKCLSDGTESAS